MNWEQFLADNSIEYVTSGPNTKRGEVSVKCPWCGDNDPSQHLGINLTREAWGCHRDASHRGKSPIYLMQALLGCSSAQARLTLAQYEHSDPDDLEAALSLLNEVEPEKPKSLEVTFPNEFQTTHWPVRFYNYLRDRGYINPIETASRFGLMCATTGTYKDRIIFPLYLGGQLIGWTARAIIDPVKAPRYLASSANAKATLYGWPEAESSSHSVLFVVEGPFDALRINNANRMAEAVALMGTSVTISQLILLRALCKKYYRVAVMLDRGVVGQQIQIVDAIGSSKVRSINLSYHKDPSEMADLSLGNIITGVMKS